MTTFLVFVYEKSILLFDQLETGNSENIDSFLGGFWAAHRAADLLVTNKELWLCFSVLLSHFMNNFLNGIFV